MSSRRLPGKHLRPLLGVPMLVRLLERLEGSRRVDVPCVATSTDPTDDALTDVARAAGIEIYRGPLDDVLTRLVGAARHVDADVVAEITGDCPLIDPGIVDAVMGYYLRGGYDYVTNVLDGLTFPVGFDVQVFSRALLEEVSRVAADPSDRENVTSYIYQRPDRYRLLNVRAPSELHRPRYRLCVDYIEDLEVVTGVYDALYPRSPAFDAFEIVAFLDNRPDLAGRNVEVPNAFEWPSSGNRAAQIVCPREAVHG